jgi:GNAT superfamily N-acetyltransferase
MAGRSIPAASVHLLADRPELIASVGALRWREWGRYPEPEDPSWWEATTRQEAGRSCLPVTFVAVDDHDGAVGAVGLGQYDLEERQDVSPWVMGMIVRTDRRGEGVGRALMAELEAWAAADGVAQVWVATGQAAGFYRRCG